MHKKIENYFPSFALVRCSPKGVGVISIVPKVFFHGHAKNAPIRRSAGVLLSGINLHSSNAPKTLVRALCSLI